MITIQKVIIEIFLLTGMEVVRTISKVVGSVRTVS